MAYLEGALYDLAESALEKFKDWAERNPEEEASYKLYEFADDAVPMYNKQRIEIVLEHPWMWCDTPERDDTATTIADIAGLLISEAISDYLYDRIDEIEEIQDEAREAIQD